MKSNMRHHRVILRPVRAENHRTTSLGVHETSGVGGYEDDVELVQSIMIVLVCKGRKGDANLGNKTIAVGLRLPNQPGSSVLSVRSICGVPHSPAHVPIVELVSLPAWNIGWSLLQTTNHVPCCTKPASILTPCIWLSSSQSSRGQVDFVLCTSN